ncbi:MAG: response regulator transcription factor [Synechococcaceae cyanobacterium SM2_3_2]|nr:response regulator transcription factor [Synechococcaceae cyanobacterium SM2_3_2]
MRILLVEDDGQLSDSLVDALTAQSYVVDAVRDGEMAWQQLQISEYDLALLDVTLPKLDGIRLCRRIRDRGQSLPVLMLTARDTSDDKVLGLDAGADVYMIKPFDLQELLAQIRASLRRGQSSLSPILSWGSLTLHPTSYEVSYGNTGIRLTPKEFSILELLMQNGRRVLSRTFLLERLWSISDPPHEETIKAHIKGLRKKLSQAGAPQQLIETVHGVGYRLRPF